MQTLETFFDLEIISCLRERLSDKIISNPQLEVKAENFKPYEKVTTKENLEEIREEIKSLIDNNYILKNEKSSIRRPEDPGRKNVYNKNKVLTYIDKIGSGNNFSESNETFSDEETIIKTKLIEERMVCDYPNLKSIGVNLDHISDHKFLAAKKVLLDNCNLSSIKNLNSFISLQELDLSSNKLSKIENLSHLEDLKRLDLSFNSIKEISGLCDLKKLVDLSLYSNFIEEIQGLKKNFNLVYLSLGKNKIHHLSSIQDLRVLNKLEYLSLQGNPVTKKPNYRELVLSLCPSLFFLDKSNVRKGESDSKLSDQQQMEQIGLSIPNSNELINEDDDFLYIEDESCYSILDSFSKTSQRLVSYIEYILSINEKFECMKGLSEAQMQSLKGSFKNQIDHIKAIRLVIDNFKSFAIPILQNFLVNFDEEERICKKQIKETLKKYLDNHQIKLVENLKDQILRIVSSQQLNQTKKIDKLEVEFENLPRKAKERITELFRKLDEELEHFLKILESIDVDDNDDFDTLILEINLDKDHIQSQRNQIQEESIKELKNRHRIVLITEEKLHMLINRLSQCYFSSLKEMSQKLIIDKIQDIKSIVESS